MIKETYKRINSRSPKYFKKWFLVYVLTAIMGLGAELNAINDQLPDSLKFIPKYLITIGTVGLFMARLPEPNNNKEDSKES